MSETRERFKDAEWFKAGPQDIVIGGAGGIGSWLCMFLGRIGHNLYVYDNDTIDHTNMGGQFYALHQIGLNKAQAALDNARNFSDMSEYDVSALQEFTKFSMISPIVFSCFDNMAARKLMFESWALQEDRELFVDGRMLAETGMVFAVQKGQEDLYRTQLFEDHEVEEAPCSYKATSHCGAFIASLMTAAFNNYLTNRETELPLSTVEFKTVFELSLMHVEPVKVSIPETVLNYGI